MNLNILRSDPIYRKIALAHATEKDDIYRNELIKPFEFKYTCIGIPLKAEHDGEYDVVTAAPMGGGYLPSKINEMLLPVIDQLANEHLWDVCAESILMTLNQFEENNSKLPVQDYLFTLMLTDPENPMSVFTSDCCGDGGIPGYITGTIIPNKDTAKKMPVVLAHETNHNIRWQYIKWGAFTTLADLIVSEGLAEAYEAYRYSKEMLGPWATALSREQVVNEVNPLIYPHLEETNFQTISAYLYGDNIMKLRGGVCLGVPDYAGYSCGYYLIQHYLEKTHASIFEATITPTKEILEKVTDFWN